MKGYQSNDSKDKACEDINECETDKFICGESEYGTCNNLEGTFVCVCNQGFENRNGLDSDCIDKDECIEFDCGFNNTCINTIGSYQCDCRDGFYHKNEWEPCQDIDECSSETVPPEPGYCQGGICSNYPGGYDCFCPSYSFEVHYDGPNNVSFCGNIQTLLKIRNKDLF